MLKNKGKVLQKKKTKTSCFPICSHLPTIHPQEEFNTQNIHSKFLRLLHSIHGVRNEYYLLAQCNKRTTSPSERTSASSWHDKYQAKSMELDGKKLLYPDQSAAYKNPGLRTPHKTNLQLLNKCRCRLLTLLTLYEKTVHTTTKNDPIKKEPPYITYQASHQLCKLLRRAVKNNYVSYKISKLSGVRNSILHLITGISEGQYLQWLITWSAIKKTHVLLKVYSAANSAQRILTHSSAAMGFLYDLF